MEILISLCLVLSIDTTDFLLQIVDGSRQSEIALHGLAFLLQAKMLMAGFEELVPELVENSLCLPIPKIKRVGSDDGIQPIGEIGFYRDVVSGQH